MNRSLVAPLNGAQFASRPKVDGACIWIITFHYSCGHVEHAWRHDDQCGYSGEARVDHRDSDCTTSFKVHEVKYGHCAACKRFEPDPATRVILERAVMTQMELRRVHKDWIAYVREADRQERLDEERAFSRRWKKRRSEWLEAAFIFLNERQVLPVGINPFPADWIHVIDHEGDDLRNELERRREFLRDANNELASIAEEICSICQETLGADPHAGQLQQNVSKTLCNCTFHHACILDHFQSSGQWSNKCPNCRRKYNIKRMPSFGDVVFKMFRSQRYQVSGYVPWHSSADREEFYGQPDLREDDELAEHFEQLTAEQQAVFHDDRPGAIPVAQEQDDTMETDSDIE